MADTTKEEEKEKESSHVVSEGMMGSTPDNYEDEEVPEPLPPVTQAERDAINSRGVVPPAVESQLAAEKEFDAKPKSGEDMQKLVDAEKEKSKVVPNPPTSLEPNLDPDVVVVPSGNGGSNSAETTSKSSSTPKK